MPRKFNEDETLKFVQLYREHECLWDKRCDAYKNKEMRVSALEQLRVGMNIEELTIDEVKSKIKSIRNTYYLELDKINKSTRSGAAGSIYKPKAKWFDEYDSFVKPISIRRKTIDYIDTPNSNEPRSENGLENEFAEETPLFTPPTKPKRSKLSQISNTINDLREINDKTCNEETDLDLFGKSVSAQLKKLTEEQAVVAMEKIQSILTQCRLTDIRAKNA